MNSGPQASRIKRNGYTSRHVISAGKISSIIDRVLPEIQAWRPRQLGSLYAIVYLDVVHLKVRHEGQCASRAFNTVYGIDADGQRDLLGLYVNESEGASRWGLVLEDIRSQGV